MHVRIFCMHALSISKAHSSHLACPMSLHVARSCSMLYCRAFVEIPSYPATEMQEMSSTKNRRTMAHHDINLDMHKFLSVVILQYKHTERERERDTHTHDTKSKIFVINSLCPALDVKST